MLTYSAFVKIEIGALISTKKELLNAAFPFVVLGMVIAHVKLTEKPAMPGGKL
jgi:hypothetical protein